MITRHIVCLIFMRFLTFSDTSVAEVSRWSAERLVTQIVDSLKVDAAQAASQLFVNWNWSSQIVNAAAYRHRRQWSVVVSGGLPRMSGINSDAFQFAICHEMGHLFGGYPFTSRNPAMKLSSEAQSDYFAAHICLRKIWQQDQKKNLSTSQSAPKSFVRHCRKYFKFTKERALCVRTINAAYHLLVTLKPETRPGYVKLAATMRTNFNGYPSSQCRLNNIMRAAVCPGPKYQTWPIPGLLGTPGINNTLAAENIAIKFSCSAQNFQHGARDPCWFRPLGSKQ